MAKVLSILPEIRFTKAGVQFPPELSLLFENVRQEDEIIAACRDMDFLFVPAAFPPITANVLRQIPSIQMIQSAGAGYDQVDVEAATALQIPVANSPGHNTSTVAELTLAMVIALQRSMIRCDREIKSGGYQPLRDSLFKAGMAELGETTLGLIGLGAIGRKVAQVSSLLGATLYYYDVRRLPAAEEQALGVSFKPVDELLATCGAISLHIPLTANTRGLIGRRELARMPAGAYLINTSRGELVDPQALAEALEGGQIAGAALDTLAPEPPPADHPLLNLSPQASDRLLLTPHIGGTTQGAFRRMLTGALLNLQRVASGGAPQYVVNGVVDARTPGNGG